MEYETVKPSGRSGEHPATGQRPDGGNGCEPSAAKVFGKAAQHLREIQEYTRYYLSAKGDAVKSSAKRIGLYAGLGVLGLVAGVAVIVTAAVLLLLGLAGALSRIFDLGPWFGQMVVGFLVLAGIGLGAYLMLKRIFKLSKRKTVERYEERQRQQRQRFGHTVEDRATEAGVTR